jgi:hypothetical protein
MPAVEPEPRPLDGELLFEEGDFHALSSACARDPQYNDRRLRTRRVLGALAKELAARAREAGLALDTRTSLHQPHAFNGMRVSRIWAYAMRSKAEKARLRRVLGPDLGKDLDAAYRNAYLCLAVEEAALEVSLRVHPDAWYDGQNLIRRVAAEGLDGWLLLLNRLSGFRLRLADWKGEWRCGALDRDRLREFLKYYEPGTHALAVELRLPAPPGARGRALEPDLPGELVAQAARLFELYRFTAWSKESDFLFRS